MNALDLLPVSWCSTSYVGILTNVKFITTNKFTRHRGPGFSVTPAQTQESPATKARLQVCLRNRLVANLELAEPR